MNRATDPEPTTQAREVRCPGCSGPSLYSTQNPYRPFCSARCKGLDLGAWASEGFRLPDDTPPDDVPFGDPRLQ